jgi:hypothetical protein|tara:strand:- start:25 stop:279 length:255 start_codon:yes stop_codon:yes gene_type:complete
MTRLSIARTLTGAGMGATAVSCLVSLIGIVGVAATAGAACPESVGAVRCNAAGRQAAGLAASAFLAAGLSSAVAVAGVALDPDA